MRNLVIILDPAHGKNVVGKCSPDSTHKEYLWSRQRVSNLKEKLLAEGFRVFVTTESIDEPGLSKRRNFANNVAKGSKKLLLSLHNNASGNCSEWKNARGFCAYTTKGETKSDKCAKAILEQLAKDFPTLRLRKYSESKFGWDFEENFSVLIGKDYMAVLVEWLFQDNKEDLVLLKDFDTNKKFEDSIVKALCYIDESADI